MSIPAKSVGDRAGIQYQKALDALEVAERRLSRQFNAWAKARARLRSLGKRLDGLSKEQDEPPLGESKQAREMMAAIEREGIRF